MTDYTFGSLLSSTGTQSLSKYLRTSVEYTNYDGTVSNKSYSSILSGIDGGFNNSSIFTNSSGLYKSNSNSSNSGTTSTLANIHSHSIGNSNSIFSSGSFGSSLVSNYYTSIQSVVVGQNLPKSILEQRLNYHGLTSQPYTNENLRASESNSSSNPVASVGQARTSSSVSELMSLLSNC